MEIHHWSPEEEEALDATDAGAAGQAEGAEDGDTTHMVVMPADPAAPVNALDTTVGPQARAHRRRRHEEQERLYFQLSRAAGPPLSIDVQRALEVGHLSFVWGGVMSVAIYRSFVLSIRMLSSPHVWHMGGS